MAAPPSDLDQSARRSRAAAALYTQGVVFSFTLGMLLILVPLYILSLGYDVAGLGLIISAQGLFQVILRLFGGAFADRVGERWVILVSLASLLLGSLLMAAFEELAPLVAAQLLLGASRAIYWTSSQSYGSRIDEARASLTMGRFFGFGSGGQLVGTFFGGIVAGTVGYSGGFLIGVGLCAATMVTVAFMPDLPRKAAKSIRAILAPVPRAFRSRATILPAIAGFGTSLAASLVGSVLQAFFVDAGYDEATIGTLRAVHAFGAVIAGFAFGVALARMGQRMMYASVLVGNGAFLGLIVATGDAFWPTLLVMFALGMAFNAGRVLYAGMTADMSTPEQRGVFMAVLGIYWALAQLIGPAMFGVMGSIFGISAALITAGVAIASVGLLTPLLYRLFGSRAL